MRKTTTMNMAWKYGLLVAVLLETIPAARPAPPTPSATTAKTEKKETIRFRYLRPSTLGQSLVGESSNSRPEGRPAAVYLADGVRQIAVNDKTRELIVAGSPAALEHFHRICQLLDVAPLRCRFRVRILRVLDQAHRDRALIPGRVVATGMIDATNSEPVSLTLRGEGKQFDITLTPHIYGDATVRVDSQLALQRSGARSAAGKGLSATSIVRSATPSRLITLTTDLQGQPIAAGQREGENLLPSGTTYSLEVTATPLQKH